MPRVQTRKRSFSCASHSDRGGSCVGCRHHCCRYFCEDVHEEMRKLLWGMNTNEVLCSSRNGLLWNETRTGTELFKASYFNRIPRLWNVLPLDVRSFQTLVSFKSELLHYYCTKLQTVYTSYNSCTWTSICRCTGYYHGWKFYFLYVFFFLFFHFFLIPVFYHSHDSSRLMFYLSFFPRVWLLYRILMFFMNFNKKKRAWLAVLDLDSN